jgi:tetratricopeptide (TPR) repeat protein
MSKAYQEALMDLSIALELDPQHTQALRLRGVLYGFEERYPEAIQDFTRAIQLDPSNSYAFLGRGDCYADQRDYPRAIQDYSIGIQLDPEYEELYTHRGRAHLIQGNYQKAIEDYSRAIELDQENSSAYIARGLALAQTKNYSRAISDFTQALHLEPTNYEILEYRADVYMQSGQASKAVEDYSEALRINPDDGELRAALATASKVASGAIKPLSDEAVNIFNQVIEMVENASSDSYERVCRNAIPLLSVAITKAGAPFPRAHSLTATFYLDLGDYQAAWNSAEKALKEDPEEFRAQYVKTYIAADTVQTGGNFFKDMAGAMTDKSIFGSFKKAFNAGSNATAARVSHQRLNQEAKNLITVFEQLCHSPLEASEYLFYIERLLSLADAIVQNNLPLDRNISFYRSVASSPTNNLVYRSDEERQAIATNRRIAQGRAGQY